MLERLEDEKLLRTTEFLLRFLAVGIIFRIVSSSFETFMPLQQLYASLTTIILNLVGFEAVQKGVNVFLSDWFEITRDCTGWKSVFALVGLSIGSRSYEIKKILAGASLLMFLNLLRIITVILLHHTGIASFSVSHGLIWRWGLTTAVFGYWAILMDKNV